MFSFPDFLRPAVAAGALALLGTSSFAQTVAIKGIGRAATPSELAAWDIDVRPDFKGLPKGSGSVAMGTDVWEAKCASCHGIFGESNEVFTPLVGGTTKEDVKSGRVARLLDPAFPGRTTFMKVATVSTLFDYVRRAMPWNAPKSLTTDEVYGVVAYLLNLAYVVPGDFTLSDKNIASVQQLMPNRNGMTTNHGMWPGAGIGNGGKPDVKAVACMKDCAAEPSLRSFLPDFARNAHGNLAEQNRMVGAQHGADTTQAPGAAPAAPTAPVAPKATTAASDSNAAAEALLKKYACTACHGIENKIIGPAYRDVAKKYADRADAADYLAGKIESGGLGVWGPIPMPKQSISSEDAKSLARWIAEGAKK
jgi:cytochrome c